MEITPCSLFSLAFYCPAADGPGKKRTTLVNPGRSGIVYLIRTVTLNQFREKYISNKYTANCLEEISIAINFPAGGQPWLGNI